MGGGESAGREAGKNKDGVSTLKREKEEQIEELTPAAARVDVFVD